MVYIQTTAAKAWNALVQGELTRQYWAHENVSDWKVGSTWEHRRADGSHRVELTGKVIEFDPPRRLMVTWAYPQDANERSRHTRVAFEIEPIGNMVRLTVTHSDLEEGSDMERGISEGWPPVLSSLKSFLETGKPLDTWAGHRHTASR